MGMDSPPERCPLLAAVASLSPVRIHEVFKSTAGVSPIEFVIGLRIRRAQELLLATGQPIGDIGLELDTQIRP